jgi:hypothetical protein
MSEPLEPCDDLEDLRRLVSAEKEEALTRFREGDFEAKLRARIAAADRAAGWAPKGLRRLRPLAVPSLIAALVLLLAVGAFLVFRRGQQGAGGETAIFVKAVGMFPGLEGLAAGPAGAAPGGGPASADPFARVLAQAYHERRAEEDRTAPAAGPAVPHFSLKKKMEILFKDRALERVLLSIHEKSKEV